MQDAEGNKAFKISGTWLSHINISKLEGNAETQTTKIYQYMQVEEEHDEEWAKQYRMTDIALNLNYMDEELEQKLPPTDAR